MALIRTHPRTMTSSYCCARSSTASGRPDRSLRRTADRDRQPRPASRPPLRARLAGRLQRDPWIEARPTTETATALDQMERTVTLCASLRVIGQPRRVSGSAPRRR
jgi:hypothetical protein